jgi:hypothetical protein
MTRKSRFGFPMLVLFLSMHSLSVNAATINAASCSQTDVQNAINSSSAGDTVVVPSGTCTYTTTLPLTPSVNITKGVTVQGQTVCTGRAATLSCADSTIINDGTTNGGGELPFNISSSGARLTGMTVFDPRGNGDFKSLIGISPGNTGWRVDHCHIHPSNSTVGGIEAHGFGLIDHNYIDTANTGVAVWGDSPQDVTYPGDYSWTQPLNPGTVNEVYVEDNEFNYSAVLNGIDNYAGARLAFRYNDVRGTNVGSHGLDSGGLRSVMLMEIYNNTLSNAGTHIFQLFVSRGGVQLNFNNTISASGGSFDLFEDLRNYRSDSSYGTSWGSCNGATLLDLNTSAMQGWPCKDQIGRGQNQTSSPDYLWGNLYKGSAPTLATINICGYSDCTRAQTYHILNNREFYNELPNFSGAAGVGSGLLSARPATCAPVVGYWATDTNTLYKCTTANTWTAYYTPYTYPHPLQNAGSAPTPPPAPPTGLAAVAN